MKATVNYPWGSLPQSIFVADELVADATFFAKMQERSARILEIEAERLDERILTGAGSGTPT